MKTLKKTKEEINNESEKKTGSFSQRFLSKKLHVFIVSAIIIAILSIGGYFYYNYSAKQIRSEKENDLQAITALKNNQLVQWRKERIADVNLISNSRFFAKGIEEWLTDRTLNQLSDDILEQLQSAITNYDYEDIFLVSTKGELYLSVLPNLKEIDNVTKTKILQITNKNEITFTDLYYCPSHHKIHYDIIAPIKNNNNNPIAFLVFRINPYEFLYPLIQSWPLPSKSAELLLVKKDGDSVLFMNELRHQKNTALQLRIPLARKDLPATQAILGKTGIFEGKDYRDIEVVACLAHVPDTNWFLVSKIDKSEIFAEINTRGIIVSIIILLLVLTLTIGMIWIYNSRQKNIYKNLWQTQEEYRTILYSIGDAVITTDINGRITNINKVAEALTGWEETKAIGKKLITVFNIINEETRAAVEDPVNKVLKSGHIVRLANHTILISKNGTEFQIADSAAPIKNEKGEIKGVILVFSDVTDKYAAQKHLKESEERFNLAMQASNDGLFDWNLETNGIYYSPAWKRMLGYEESELPNDFSVWENTTEKEDVKKSWELQQKLISKQIDRFVLEFKMKHKDGHFVDILSRAEAIFNENGKAIRIIGTHTDITERKRAEEKYRKLVEHMNSGVAIYQPINEGRDFKFIDFNKAAEKITNTTKNIVVGSTLLTQFPNMAKSPLFKAIQVVNKSGGNKYLPPFHYKDNQREGWRENFIYKLPTNEIVAIFDDVTEQKNTEIKLQNQNAELIKAKEKAEESDRLKSAFLANMSHEIRTPMNGILGFANLLKEPDLTGKQQKDYIEIIQKSGDRMLNTINDIIEISRIETGQIRVASNQVNISEHLITLYNFFMLEAEKKGLKLIIDNQLTEAEFLIKTDKNKIGSIVTNLIKNAIKFTDKGSITIRCIKKGEFLEFNVTDTGLGIPANRIESIFNRFEQADIEDSRAFQGSGLGLSIAKSYVEMLDGKIWVESEEGKGSTFYFTIPFNAGKIEIHRKSENQVTKDLSSQIKKLKILIVEDDETSNLFLNTILKEQNTETISANNGNEAISLCRENPDLDLILMDIKMPVMDGYETTRQIRKFNKDVIIIAQTAYGLAGDRDKAILAGCNEYLPKPIEKKKLMSLIEQYFNN